MSDNKLTIDQIEVPPSAIAAVQSWWNCDPQAVQMVKDNATLSLCISAARVVLLQLANYPIVPTRPDEIDELWSMETLNYAGENPKAMHVVAIQSAWQRRMFLKREPELPEEVKVLLLKHGFQGNHFEGAPSSLAKALTEAYELGKKAGAR